MKKFMSITFFILILFLLFMPAFQVAEPAPEQSIIALDNQVNLECQLETPDVLTVQAINQKENYESKLVNNEMIDEKDEDETVYRMQRKANFLIRFS